MVEAIKQPLSPQEIAAQLGSFSPPEGHSFESEFAPAAPRPIPKRLRAGRYETQWRQAAQVRWGVGLFFIAVSYITAVQRLGYYILPLAYLQWIGLAVIAVSVGVALYHFLMPCRYVYVRDGQPIVVRVLKNEQVVSPRTNEFCFATLVEYMYPQTKQISYRTIVSPKKSGLAKPERYSVTAQPGDYVTAAYLPGKFDKTIQLYGYLGLSPDVDFLLKDGKPISESLTLAKTLSMIVGIVAVLGALVAGLYAIMFRAPIDNAWTGVGTVVGIGGLLIGTAMMLSIRGKQKIARPIWFFMSMVVLGVVATYAIAVIVNSAFDRSTPQFREIEVVEFWQTTHDFIVRNYEIEYRELASGQKRKYPAMVEKMQFFRNPRAGAIEVGQGFLGWPWVREIHPVVIVRLPELKDEPEVMQQLEQQFSDMAIELEGQKVVLAVLTDKKQLLSISKQLRKIALENLQKSGGLADMQEKNQP